MCESDCFDEMTVDFQVNVGKGFTHQRGRPHTVQRPKNLGSRVALLPGKFLRVRTVFALRTEKKPFKLSQYFQND